MKVGVVGRTGAGKSTMGITMSRIVELMEGCIEIDGVDISKVELKKLRQKVTVIAQDPSLFTGSLLHNVDPFDKEDPKIIKELFGRAGLDDVLKRSES